MDIKRPRFAAKRGLAKQIYSTYSVKTRRKVGPKRWPGRRRKTSPPPFRSTISATMRCPRRVTNRTFFPSGLMGTQVKLGRRLIGTAVDSSRIGITTCNGINLGVAAFEPDTRDNRKFRNLF